MLSSSTSNLISNSSNKTESKLSSGPFNPKHKTFLRNEKKIQNEVFRAVADRNISTRVSHVCKQINLSQPTFYLHHRNCNEALASYEDKLLQEFAQVFLADYNRIEVFTSLLDFVQRYHRYFEACFKSRNLYLIVEMLSSLRPYLVNSATNTKTYILYSSTIIALLAWWGKSDCFSKRLMPDYIRQLMSLRITYYE